MQSKLMLPSTYKRPKSRFDDVDDDAIPLVHPRRSANAVSQNDMLPTTAVRDAAPAQRPSAGTQVANLFPQAASIVRGEGGDTSQTPFLTAELERLRTSTNPTVSGPTQDAADIYGRMNALQTGNVAPGAARAMGMMPSVNWKDPKYAGAGDPILQQGLGLTPRQPISRPLPLGPTMSPDAAMAEMRDADAAIDLAKSNGEPGKRYATDPRAVANYRAEAAKGQAREAAAAETPEQYAQRQQTITRMNINRGSAAAGEPAGPTTYGGVVRERETITRRDRDLAGQRAHELDIANAEAAGMAKPGMDHTAMDLRNKKLEAEIEGMKNRMPEATRIRTKNISSKLDSLYDSLRSARVLKPDSVATIQGEIDTLERELRGILAPAPGAGGSGAKRDPLGILD